MGKFIQTYCTECKRETTHEVRTENGYGASSIMGKVVTTIISVGMCWLCTDTYCVCCSCGKRTKVY